MSNSLYLLVFIRQCEQKELCSRMLYKKGSVMKKVSKIELWKCLKCKKYKKEENKCIDEYADFLEMKSIEDMNFCPKEFSHSLSDILKTRPLTRKEKKDFILRKISFCDNHCHCPDGNYIVVFDFSPDDETVTGYLLDHRFRPFTYIIALDKFEIGKPIKCAYVSTE